MSKPVDPPKGKSLNYYIGWFKQEVGHNDLAQARWMAEEYMKTERRPKIKKGK